MYIYNNIDHTNYYGNDKKQRFNNNQFGSYDSNRIPITIQSNIQVFHRFRLSSKLLYIFDHHYWKYLLTCLHLNKATKVQSPMPQSQNNSVSMILIYLIYLYTNITYLFILFYNCNLYSSLYVHWTVSVIPIYYPKNIFYIYNSEGLIIFWCDWLFFLLVCNIRLYEGRSEFYSQGLGLFLYGY